MAKKIVIERLEGKGIKAKVIKAGERYSTYGKFANAAGYPNSVNNSIVCSEIRGEVVDVLAKGNHEQYNDTIYVCQLEDGRQFLIGEDGIDLFSIPTLKTATFEALLDELMERIKGGEGEMPAVGPVLNRADIVAQAKADIEGLKTGRYYDLQDPADPMFPFNCKVEFIVNAEKRTVVALLRGAGSGVIRGRGIAKCDPSDCFNEHIGKAIALRRALGLDVPSEYLNAPEPEGVQVGDVVRVHFTGETEYFEGTVSVACDVFEGMHQLHNIGPTSMDSRDGDRVINDSARY
ncbi:hypothetical protein [Bacillus sp. 7894-2]|uniref:hypothetical protein n=1 Tax=Bacillus sp. 7894-2 TaxID=2021695 RepID=UPI000BA597D9|nr:hypothetical protein [Bacillus sp. 7894-2]PAE24015.1 hypothetical protein CHI10_14510 [Bacillus sp. 7894-2]